MNDGFRHIGGRHVSGFRPAPEEEGTRHGPYIYMLLVMDHRGVGRKQGNVALLCRSIGIGIHPRALNLDRCYNEIFGWKRGDSPNAEWSSDRLFSLRLSPKLTDPDEKSGIFEVGQSFKHFPLSRAFQ